MREYNAMYDWLESFKLNVYIENFVKGGFDMTSMKGLTAEVRFYGLITEKSKLPNFSKVFLL